MINNMNLTNIIISVVGYAFLLGTSGIIVRSVLLCISKDALKEKVTKETLDTGVVVGKCENLLILTFMILGEYTALALIFAAKAIVRGEDMKKNSLFFLAGTMVNTTYSIMFGLVLKMLLQAF